MGDRFSARFVERGTDAVIEVAGEVDYETRDTLSAAIADALAQRPARLIVDLQAVTFIDSVGVDVAIASPARAANSLGMAFAVEPSAPVLRILTRMGLDDLVDRARDAGTSMPGHPGSDVVHQREEPSHDR